MEPLGANSDPKMSRMVPKLLRDGPEVSPKSILKNFEILGGSNNGPGPGPGPALTSCFHPMTKSGT